MNDKQSPNTWAKNFCDYIWPITKQELPKFLSITLLLFCILFIQNLIRALKDGIVITMIGTETISFLKFWGVLPAAFIMTMIYVKLINFMRGEYIFYLILSVFLIFFGIFGFVIFPQAASFHLSEVQASHLITQFPHLKWFILLVSKWGFSVFYIIAELWPSVVFSLLFWQFVNSVTTVDESKRFYALFGLLGQTGLYISGSMLERLPDIGNYIITHYNLSTDRTVICVQLILFVVVLLGTIALCTFWVLNHKVLQRNTSEIKFTVKARHLSVAESFKMALSSRYIRLIAILLICYGISINLVEGPWKAKASSIYPSADEYTAFVGNYLKYTGILTIVFVLLGSNIVRSLGWFAAAIITPCMVFITGMLFFSISNSEAFAGFIVITLAFSDPTMIAIIVGAIQNVLSKSSKYTLFDSTKEMAYVPLPDELKTRGKAAADVIGTKLGKSMSALLQSLIFMIIPAATYNSISIYLMVVFAIICLVWIWAVRELGIEYKQAVDSAAK
jgi:AAA family ATP:ADP antiporter